MVGLLCILSLLIGWIGCFWLVCEWAEGRNIDSLAYHLARMAHWIQQSGVQHYPTDDLRQLEFGPWSSFVMTNLFLLWGNDQLLNLAQWFAMVSSVIVLSWVAEQSWRLWRM